MMEKLKAIDLKLLQVNAVNVLNAYDNQSTRFKSNETLNNRIDKNPLRVMAKKRADENKLKEIDCALRVLCEDATKDKHIVESLKSNILQQMLEEVEQELKESDIPIKSGEDVQRLIYSLA